MINVLFLTHTGVFKVVFKNLTTLQYDLLRFFSSLV
jgi:hypothetical protein